MTMLAADEARAACRGDMPLEERIKKAMHCTKNHWLLTDQGLQLSAAMAAVILETKDESEKDLITRSYKNLALVNATMHAAISGVPIDIESLPKPDPDLLSLTNMWREA
jgi:hypothetical protein